MPNIASVPPGQVYNYEVTSAPFKLTGWQPVLRVDYQLSQKLRTSFKFFEYQQSRVTIPGTIPGFNETRLDNPATYVDSAAVDWTVNPSTFVEATYGSTFHHQEGCTIAGGSPNFCQGVMPVRTTGRRRGA